MALRPVPKGDCEGLFKRSGTSRLVMLSALLRRRRRLDSSGPAIECRTSSLDLALCRRLSLDHHRDRQILKPPRSAIGRAIESASNAGSVDSSKRRWQSKNRQLIIHLWYDPCLPGLAREVALARTDWMLPARPVYAHAQFATHSGMIPGVKQGQMFRLVLNLPEVICGVVL